MKRIEFTVDAALLRELGERLVGRPHIALAELIKNSYDADATRVIVRFDDDSIEVEDNGHGMTFEEFRDGWMRVGTPHKQRQQYSRQFERPLTGSKGVGRLSAQFLAIELELRTVAANETSSELHALIDWGDAVTAGELTRATALYEESEATSPFDGTDSGTLIRLSGLNQRWDVEAFKLLAKELWALQPPFDLATEEELEAVGGFEVSLDVPDDPGVSEEFDETMARILELDIARVRGRLIREPNGRPHVEVALTFDDGEHLTEEYEASDLIESLDFEIRVFDLRGRQRYNIKVDDAREYLSQYGGVHVYDAGFHMPYYGVDTDWLDVEKDHARRLSRSRLLPDDLQVSDGMTHLPSNRRLFGIVRVDTAREASANLPTPARERLAIQVTRDRLVANSAYEELKRIVRWSLDFYATQQARRVFARRRESRSMTAPSGTAKHAMAVLESHRDEIPDRVYEEIGDSIEATIEASEAETERIRERAGLLGALATAGIAAVAYEHELTKQFRAIERISRDLRSGRKVDHNRLASKLDDWVARARRTQALFTHLVDEEDREIAAVFSAKRVVESTLEQTELVLHGLDVDVGLVADDVKLPRGTIAQWTAVLHNALFNAHDATLVSDSKKIRIRTTGSKNHSSLLIEDTGAGVNLDEADALFEPFTRRLELPSDLRALRLGTSGLGLTIIKMICDELGCKVEFVEPPEGYATTLQISWRNQ